MFKLIKCTENTYYLNGYTHVGVYYLGGNEAVLIDSGDHKKSVSDLDAALCERGWRVKMIVNTHAHADHVAGNRFFMEKYGCDIYAPETERQLISEKSIEGALFFSGIPAGFANNVITHAEGTPAKLLTKEALPDGFEIMPLPGHSFNMAGIRTPDGVWFLGDSLLAPETYDYYKLPFFLLTNESIETALSLGRLGTGLFVPAHAPHCTDVTELAEYNAAALRRNKSLIFELCNGRSLEEIMAAADERMGLRLNVDKYAKMSLTVRGILQGLIDDGAVGGGIEGARLIYRVR